MRPASYHVARRRGAEIISLSIEKDLLKRAEGFAKSQGLSRSELFARGLRAILTLSGAA
jgi:metal-responsive CopG/Arc/MetJ family transcriptional regulator